MQNESDIQQLSYFTLNQLNEPFFWINEEGTIQHVNPAAIKLSGLKYDEKIIRGSTKKALKMFYKT